ncbi:MAG: peptidase [Porticoccus sp.]|nr:MAG: peptidase [Porticoccus sp.]
MAAGLAVLVWAAFTPSKARVVYNASDSVPIGWYHITLLGTDVNAIPVDSIVLVDLPDAVAVLADQRGYLPLDVPLLKRVGAMAPQHVCIVGGTLYIDSVPVAHVLLIDAQARPLPSWTHCRQLDEGELFLLSTTNPASFDSRYFGPIDRANVIGVAHRFDLE